MSGAIAFLHPWLLILVPLCALFPLAVGRLRRSSLSAYADPALLHWLAPWRAARRRSGTLWVMAAAILAVLAAAGPVLTEHEESRPLRALDLALVFDISPSMTAPDPAPTRLQRARMETHDLIEQLRGNRLALIAFSAHAYRVLPLTHDIELLRSFVDALDPGLTRHRGSNLVQALETAAASLERSPAGSRAIIVVSDGETDDASAVRAAASRLAERGIPAFVLGVGSTSGAPVAGPLGYLRDEAGELHMSRLDRETLLSLALLTGGRYTDMRADASDTAHLLAGITSLRTHEAGREISPGLPLYPWLLMPALLIALMLSRRYLSPAMLVLPLVLTIAMTGAEDAEAAPWDEYRAWNALQSGNYEKAAALYRHVGGYRGHMGAGTAAWRSGDWAQARESFHSAAKLARNERERITAWYNEANAAARMNDIAGAVELLDRVISLYPGHTRAARNRVLLQSLLEDSDPADGSAVARPADSAQRIAAAGLAVDEAAEGQGDATTDDAAHGQPQGGSSAATAPGGTPDENGSGAAAMLRFADREPGNALPVVTDDPREVLRHRFMVMDASRVQLPETRPW